MFNSVTIMASSCLLIGALTTVTGWYSEERCEGGNCHQCTLPSVTGFCKGYFPRYFFNVKTCECERFIYGGCGGNENRYDSIDECQLQCNHIQCPVCNLPPEKGAGRASTKRWYFDAADCTCKAFKYRGSLGNHNNFPSKADCEGACGNYPCPVCSQPADRGKCAATFIRWHYVATADWCQPFIWGGCEPNGNNFITRRECERVCKGFACTLPMDVGPCDGVYERYYYDQASGTCKLFIWGGCEPNGNNFETRRLCERTCRRTVCKQPMDVGPCDGAFKRYYYDQASKTCKVFIWGGCQPNGNNFESKKDCKKTCIGDD